VDNYRITLTSKRKDISLKTPHWKLIADLKEVTFNEKMQRLVLTFNNNKLYCFEPKNPQQAAEIVAKLKVCSNKGN